MEKDKKPAVALIIANKMKEKAKEGEGEKKMEGYKELAQMIIDSCEKGDAEKFAKDLKSFVKMCMAE
jgi:hypothetical protein